MYMYNTVLEFKNNPDEVNLPDAVIPPDAEVLYSDLQEVVNLPEIENPESKNNSEPI
jgi:hypothetical protein